MLGIYAKNGPCLAFERNASRPRSLYTALLRIRTHALAMSLSPIQPALPPDLADISALEVSSYPPDEAASLARMAYRLNSAPDLCWVLREPALSSSENDDTAKGSLIGFVIGTAAAAGSTALPEESMSWHDAAGTVVCVHSVVVREDLRRRGFAGDMLRQFVEKLKRAEHGYERVVLITKLLLVPLYSSVGFVEDGPSIIEHGRDTWIDMRLELR